MGDQICSIDGCGKAVKYKGWCTAHYKRWLRNGDPLGGKATPGSLMKWIKDVAMAYEGDECLTWPFGTDGAGRGSVWVDGRHQKPHRIICELAHGAPPVPELWAAHSCGKGHLGCVAKKHLRWATPAENAADSMAHGTFVKGEASPHAVLTEIDVHMIRTLSDKGFPACLVANKFGVSSSHVRLIKQRKSWKWLPEEAHQPISRGSANE